MTPSVYIVRPGDQLVVKIGWALNPEARRRALQGTHWEELRIIRTFPGTQSAEAWMHRKFADLRVRSEWFTFDAAMLTVQPPPWAIAGRMDTASRDIITRLGGATPIAAALGIKRNAVWQWHQNGIPPKHWYPLAAFAERSAASVTLDDLEDSWKALRHSGRVPRPDREAAA